MFHLLGTFVTRFWLWVLVAWALLLAGTWLTAPDWNAVAESGEFRFLPEQAQSRQAEELLKQAYPDDEADSNIVIVLRRQQGETLRDADREFITDRLAPALEELAGPDVEANQATNGNSATDDDTAEEPSRNAGSRPTDEDSDDAHDDTDTAAETSGTGSFITQIRTPDDPLAGALLVSPDERAALVVIGLTTEFLDRRNIDIVNEVRDRIEQLHGKGAVPGGLDIGITGSAAVGRDLLHEEDVSARAIENWTIYLVVAFLLIVFRMPLLALIPLVTLYVAVQVALKLLSILAGAGYVGVFRGLEVYSMVIVYGAGVDYGLFLISRYKEERDAKASGRAAIARSLDRVGTAISASAGTEIIGIGMLMFASFRKFTQAGFSIPFGLIIMLLASLTLTPALLRLSGRWAFWPQRPGDSEPDDPDASSIRGRLARFTREDRLGGLWRWIGGMLLKRPGTIWLITMAVMSPLAIFAVINYNRLTYGLVEDLPRNAPSLHGTSLLREHFPGGATGPLTVLIRNNAVDFSGDAGIEHIKTLADRLEERKDTLRIRDVRSVADPLGITEAGRAALPGGGDEDGGFFGGLVDVKGQVRTQAVAQYISSANSMAGHVTRLEILLDVDPFTREALDHFDTLREGMYEALPEALRTADTQILIAGATASQHDLREVAGRDRWRIQVLVTLSVLGVLMLLLRRVAVPIYLILSVLFSYLVTLGISFGVFWLLDREGFVGLDWTVPIFLFTLLIAVGIDYNILLVTRADEEQQRHGPTRGVAEAVTRTGGVISACGFVMAGTFSSLAVGGSLASLYQLGFALACGVLIDTFIVRPLLVPSYLILIHSGRFGRLGKLLGGQATPDDDPR